MTLSEQFKQHMQSKDAIQALSFFQKLTEKERLLLSNQYDDFKQAYAHTYKPKWLKKYLYENVVNYTDVIGLITLGYEFSDTELVERFVNSVQYYDVDKSEMVFDITHFFDYELVLKAHFWLIFSEPTAIHIKENESLVDWQTIICDLVANNHIDRMRVLKESLLTCTGNFNKSATGWFLNLFEALQPTKKERISLLPEHMLVLNSVHSNPVNTVLKHFKTLCLHADFKTDEFLAMSEVLLASDVKAVINNTFAVFENIAKNQPDKQETLSILACSALIHADEKIQTKGAKFILKYGDASNETLKENIANYYAELFSSVKTLLAPLSLNTPEEDKNRSDTEFTYTPINRLDEANRIHIPESFDDQIFFITQAFENNEPYHFDVYLAVMTKLIPQINQDNMHHLAPAMKNAMRAMTATGNRTGFVDYLMGIHFVNMIQALNDQYHEPSLIKLYQQIQSPKPSWYPRQRGNSSFTMPVERLNLPYPSMQIWVDLLSHAKQLASESNMLPMLSTPTHSPCFIEPQIFCERLAIYQQHQAKINITDFQLAISRLVPRKTQEKPSLTGEYADIVNYLLMDKPIDFSKCNKHELWVMVMYKKGKQALEKYIQQVDLPVSYLSASMRWHLDGTTDYDALKHDYIMTKDENIHQIPIYFRHFKEEFTELNNSEHAIFLEAQDHARLLCLAPHNPTMVAMPLITFSFRRNKIEKTEETSITSIMNILMTLWHKDFADTCYLYLSCVMLIDKKSCSQMAGELWIKATAEDNIQHDKLGQTLGKLLHSDFAPLKRFTDLLTQQLMHISSVHNQALIKLISHMIAHMNDEPIKGTKKLLELYLELLTITKTALTNIENKKLNDKLTTWAETKSLKAIIKKLHSL